MANIRSFLDSFKIREYIVIVLTFYIYLFLIGDNDWFGLTGFVFIVILSTIIFDKELILVYVSIFMIHRYFLFVNNYPFNIYDMFFRFGILSVATIYKLYQNQLKTYQNRMSSYVNEFLDVETDIEKLKSINTLMTNFSEICYIERDLSKLKNELNKLRKTGIKDIKSHLQSNKKLVYELHKFNKVTEINENTIKLFEGENKTEVIQFISRDFDDDMNLNDYINFLTHFYNEEYEPSESRESFIITLKGNRKEILLNTIHVKGSTPFFITLLINVSQLFQTKKELRISEDRFRILYENSPYGIMLQKESIIVDLNKAYAKMHGFPFKDVSQLIGKSVFDYIPESEHEKIKKIRASRNSGGGPESYRTFSLSPSRRIIPVEIRTSPVMIDNEKYTIVFITDITRDIEKEVENTLIQEKLLESHKLESLGILSGGLAHDFNNHLATILGGLSLLQESDTLSDEDKAIVNDIIISSKEASDVTNQLLTYTGKKKEKQSVLSLTDYISEIQGMARLSVPNNIVLHYELNKNKDIFIQINQSQLTQVIMNIIINASDAIGNNTGNIYISIDAVDLDFFSEDEEGSFHEGYAILKISDDGVGIPKDKLSKIFDPFYTSKSEGRGLGLSVVQGIINQINGSIEVNSIEGMGTEISINIPLTNKLPDQIIIPPEIVEIESKHTILIIEDEEIIRNMLSRMLNKIGYGVETAENGQIGIEKYKFLMNTVDLIILDLTMPVMSGEDSFKELILINPTVPIIISSGYSGDSVNRFAHYEYVDFLQKPYTVNQLKQTIGKLLEYKKLRVNENLSG